MTTCSGKGYRQVQVPVREMGEEGDGANVMEILAKMMEERRQREKEIAEERLQREKEIADERRQREQEIAAERERREREEERRVMAMQDQMEALMKMVEASLGGKTAGQMQEKTLGERDLKLCKLTDEDDIEAYLTTFERMMEAYEIPKQRWVFKLAPQLTGKGQQAYSAMSSEDATDYELVKTSILGRYNINQETYRQRFRAAKRKEGENYVELATRIMDLLKKWTKECKDTSEVLELVATEQLLQTLPMEVQIWVSERKPKTVEETGKLAEDFTQARQMSTSAPDKGRMKPTHLGKGEQEVRRCHSCGKTCHEAKDYRRGNRLEQGVEAKAPIHNEKNPKFVPRCYNCQQKGHLAVNCPSNPSLFSAGTGNRKSCLPSKIYRKGTVNGVSVTDILLDTGASRTLVRRDLVSGKSTTGKTFPVKCAHGHVFIYPTIEVELQIKGEKFLQNVGVADNLPVSVILGWDFPLMETFLKQDTGDKIEDAMVLTRAQKRKQELQNSSDEEKDRLSGAEGHKILAEDVSDTTWPFDDSVFVGGRVKEKKSRKQRREELARHQVGLEAVTTNLKDQHLVKLMKEDESLSEIRSMAAGKTSRVVEGFYEENGLVHRKWLPSGRTEDMVIDQLVLPSQCRSQVLELAHSVPLAGHLGRKKTEQRILQRFYWPGVHRDVASYCKQCAECQKSSMEGRTHAPLIPLPIISEPFARVAMDIVGPLPRSKSGNNYILVMCDYATRYPEAVPLKTTDAVSVAEELLKVFCRVGFPNEILTDQGSNFMSQLL